MFSDSGDDVAEFEKALEGATFEAAVEDEDVYEDSNDFVSQEIVDGNNENKNENENENETRNGNIETQTTNKASLERGKEGTNTNGNKWKREMNSKKKKKKKKKKNKGKGKGKGNGNGNGNGKGQGRWNINNKNGNMGHWEDSEFDEYDEALFEKVGAIAQDDSTFKKGKLLYLSNSDKKQWFFEQFCFYYNKLPFYLKEKYQTNGIELLSPLTVSDSNGNDKNDNNNNELDFDFDIEDNTIRYFDKPNQFKDESGKKPFWLQAMPRKWIDKSKNKHKNKNSNQIENDKNENNENNENKNGNENGNEIDKSKNNKNSNKTELTEKEDSDDNPLKKRKLNNGDCVVTAIASNNNDNSQTMEKRTEKEKEKNGNGNGNENENENENRKKTENEIAWSVEQELRRKEFKEKMIDRCDQIASYYYTRYLIYSSFIIGEHMKYKAQLYKSKRFGTKAAQIAKGLTNESTNETTNEGTNEATNENKCDKHKNKSHIYMAEFAGHPERLEAHLAILPPKDWDANISDKYWYQRYRLFSKFDNGIKVDAQSWFSVTPEQIAQAIATNCACNVIVDAMCGVGGNAIQFAKTCNHVIAIDIDIKRLEMAKNNAKIYGVEKNIEFICCDYFEWCKKMIERKNKINAKNNMNNNGSNTNTNDHNNSNNNKKRNKKYSRFINENGWWQDSNMIDVIFLSPPWGGAFYTQRECDLKLLGNSIDGEQLFHISRQLCKNIAFYVPKNTSDQQLQALLGTSRNYCQIDKNKLYGKIKAKTAYYGNLCRK